jgi:outer membrane murein-binding lipoprotein Lpp
MLIDEMDESSQKKKGFDAIITAVNMVAMGAGIAATVIAANKSKDASDDAGRIEKSISDLNAKFDRISEQLKSMQPEVSATTKEAEKSRRCAAAAQQAAGLHLRKKVVRVFLLQLGYITKTPFSFIPNAAILIVASESDSLGGYCWNGSCSRCSHCIFNVCPEQL